MDENINAITYDEDWQSVSQPEYPVISTGAEVYENTEEASDPEKPKHTAPKQLLLTVQLVACILLALAAFGIKSFGGEVYRITREWYYNSLNDTAIFDGKHHFDAMLFPSATGDEA